MGLFKRIFGSRRRTRIPHEHSEPVDPLYSDINVEDVGVYQRYFDKIIAHVNVENYTRWSMSRSYDRRNLEADDDWMYGVLQEAERDGISGGMLQNMVNQFFFADILMREQDKRCWIRRVMHPHPTDYFPGGAQTRTMMEMVSE